jgi:DNA polymerase-3 subunit beta
MPREAALTVTFTDNYAQFDCEGYSLSARLIEGRFPNYNSVIPTSNPYHVEASRADLMAAIRRISAMGSKSSELLNFGVTTDDMKGTVASIQAEDKDYSTSGYETIPVESNIDRPFHIGFKGSILLALLATHTADRVRIALADPTRAGVVTDIDGDPDLLTLLMPMMLND